MKPLWQRLSKYDEILIKRFSSVQQDSILSTLDWQERIKVQTVSVRVGSRLSHDFVDRSFKIDKDTVHERTRKVAKYTKKGLTRTLQRNASTVVAGVKLHGASPWRL